MAAERQLAPGDMEVGFTDLFLQHQRPQVAAPPPPPTWLTTYEARRPKWLMELLAEFLGVFIFCWAGEGATVQFFMGHATGNANLGSILAVALTFGVAIGMAIILVAPTSGGHLSPAVTISFALFKGFPWIKVIPYIIAQIMGAWMASLLVYVQNEPFLSELTHQMTDEGQFREIFSAAGPAGTIGLYLPPGFTKLGITFVNEFVSTTFIGIAIYSILDPTNVFVAPTSGAMTLGMIFFIVIAAFGPNGVALNLARDLGSRIAVACIWKSGHAFPRKYSGLTAMTNIAGVLCGAAIQTFFLSDSIRPHTQAALSAHSAQMEEREKHAQRRESISPTDGLLSRTVTGMSDGFQNIRRTITPTTREKKNRPSTEHIEEHPDESPLPRHDGGGINGRAGANENPFSNANAPVNRGANRTQDSEDHTIGGHHFHFKTTAPNPFPAAYMAPDDA